MYSCVSCIFLSTQKNVSAINIDMWRNKRSHQRIYSPCTLGGAFQVFIYPIGGMTMFVVFLSNLLIWT